MTEPLPAVPPPPEEPRRVSPATPFLNAWKATTALVAFAMWQARDAVFVRELPVLTLGLIFVGLIVVSAIISLLYNYLAWRRTSYGFDSESIYLHAGILFRSQRHVRLDRIQSIDLNRPLLARIFGFVSLQVTSAGSGSDNLVISYVRDDEAYRLRNEILAQAAGVTHGTGPEPAPEAPETQLMKITPGRLAGSMVRSGGLVLGFVVFLGVIVFAIIQRNPSVIFGAAVPIFVFGSIAWNRVNQEFDFTVATSPDGIRLRYGLLSTVAKTVPPGRVQAVQMDQPLLWRRKNWWQVAINVAGDAGDPQSGQPRLYPVATQAEAAHLLSLILPDLGDEEPLELIEAALRGRGRARGFTTSPRRARWIDPLVWRRTGYRATPTTTIIRRGRLYRSTIFVPNARIQSIGADQGPIERALGLTNLELHTVPGRVRPHISHLGLDDGAAFIRQASHNARLARHSSGPERWMETLPSSPDPHDEGII